MYTLAVKKKCLREAFCQNYDKKYQNFFLILNDTYNCMKKSYIKFEKKYHSKVISFFLCMHFISSYIEFEDTRGIPNFRGPSMCKFPYSLFL